MQEDLREPSSREEKKGRGMAGEHLRICPQGYTCCTSDMEDNLAVLSRRGDGGGSQRRWPILTDITHWTVQGL
ncbi:glypican-1b [Lates japonicus]|uniref:Glypican-1b n=1 Tax=Lates japonicus TaxID=270547 RepID=A0AAD3RLK6_LATJO|nr:glypican-1b [Lates japonicus]